MVVFMLEQISQEDVDLECHGRLESAKGTVREDLAVNSALSAMSVLVHHSEYVFLWVKPSVDIEV